MSVSVQTLLFHSFAVHPTMTASANATNPRIVKAKKAAAAVAAADGSTLRSRRTLPKTDATNGGAKDGFDVRHPSYLGLWKRSIPGEDDDIAMDDIDEPHIKRRHAILEKHPEVKNLFGIAHSTKYIIVAVLVCQVGMAYLFGHVWTESTAALIAASFVVGGTFTQVIGSIIHEACHGLIFKSTLLNRIAGLVANIVIPFPIAASFRRYHLEHHAYQGVVGRDPDLPLDIEIYLIKGNPFMKFLFLFFYPLMYVVRGLAMQKAPSGWEYVNWIVTLSSDAFLWHLCGPRGFLYLFLSLWFGYGIHPAAAHFIQEHFTFDDGQETYSYYGGLNAIFMNIGYHNEHHDFTKIPWTNLPALKNAAPEFYDSLASHQSWMKVHWDFIFDRTMGPQSRLGRSYDDHKRGRKMVVAKVISDEAKHWEDNNDATSSTAAAN
ncbi:fatty acid desaturase-domain-containing protein [Entophlyctis helioformis]|nr:fatty acid desaturase-domain-containing protein [Entophlyctis helioformis]